MASCYVCDSRVLRHSKVLTCCACKHVIHLKCLPACFQNSIPISELPITDWLCIDCTASLFPFNHILDNGEFMKTISEGWNSFSDFPFHLVCDQLFNPFEWNEVNENMPLFDADPDLQYLNDNTYVDNIANCDYFVEETFNRKCNQLSINDSNLSLLHLNIRSLPKNGETLERYLTNLKLNFSIIGLSETWLNESTADIYNLNGYQHLKLFRPMKKGGGVSLFVKENIAVRERRDLSIMDPNIEALFIDIPKSSVNSKNNLVVGVIYRPPNTDINTFNEILVEIIEKIKTENKTIYLLGDYNINILDQSRHIPISEFIELLYSKGIFPSITKPTRVTNNSATLIDNVFSNAISGKYFNGILVTDITDHFPIFVVNCDSNIQQKPDFKKSRILSENNIKLFANKIENVDWSFVNNSNDGPEAFKHFYEKYSTIYENCFPEKVRKVNYKNRKPWLTPGLKSAIKTKNKLYIRSSRNSCPANKEEYKTYKIRLKRVLKQAERQYYGDKLLENKSNLKNMWDILKEIIGKKKNLTKPEKFKVGNQEVTDKKVIANGFNNFFVNIGKTLSKHIPTNDNNPEAYIKSSNLNSIFLHPVQDKEVENIVVSMKNASAGYDGIHSSVLKKTFKSYLSPLTHIMNLSITQGFFPDYLKIAKVIPLHKRGDTASFNNYRPVSILPLFSKILEKLMYKRIIDFINEHEILYKYQFGFRAGHSTNMALVTLMDKIISAIDKGEFVVGVFIDLQKAFDTINHEILMNKLRKYGIRGKCYDWLTDYLACRQQFVMFDDVVSNRQTITCGVPQGSVLGPLLFILYINDIVHVSKSLFPILFADDTNIFIQGKSLNETINTLNMEMDKLVHWLNANKLSLNTAKTHYMIFKSRSKHFSDHPEVKINGLRVEFVKCTQFLGVVLDERITWSDQINKIKSKVSKGLGILCKARKVVDTTTLLTLYNSLIYPHLIYCVEVWGKAADIYISSLHKLQKKIVRVIKSASFRSESKPLFKELKILPVPELYRYGVLLFMFRFVKGSLPDIFSDLFKRNSEIVGRRTRQFYNLYIPKCRTTMYKNTIKYQGVQEWNAIQGIIDHFCSYYHFKTTVKIFLLK